jgi:hypothetical protein
MNTVSARFGEIKTGGSLIFIYEDKVFIFNNYLPENFSKPSRLLTLHLQKVKISLLLFYPNKNLSLYKEFSNIE